MITKEQSKELNQERITADNKSKAEAFLARKQADETRGFYFLVLNHSGQRGLKNGTYHDCEANQRILRDWLAANQLAVTAETLEQAFQATKDRLAQLPTEEYQRVTNTQESRVFPQIKSLQPKEPPAYAPFTREEILSWSKERLHKELAKGKAHVDAINKILEQQKLREL